MSHDARLFANLPFPQEVTCRLHYYWHRQHFFPSFNAGLFARLSLTFENHNNYI